MDNTAIQPGMPPQNGPTAQTGIREGLPGPDSFSPTVRQEEKNPVLVILQGLASLRLTVVLFALSLILVFYGTWAQVDAGIWTVVNHYFRSALVWIPLKIIFLRTWDVPGVVPFPGGWLLGGLLVVNLLAAHLLRFKSTWQKPGVFLIHAGVVVMMLSELITGLYAIEGHMRIMEGQSANYVEHSLYPELAFVRVADVKHDDVVVIPSTHLRTGQNIQDPELPVDVHVIEYMVNSEVRDPDPKQKNFATAGFGLSLIAQALPEGSGTDSEQKMDMASTYVTFKKKGTDQTLSTYLLSVHLEPQWVKLDGKDYQISLRFKRSYKPYVMHLNKFHHKFYPGTTKPKDFTSEIRLIDTERKEDREVKIYMNHPLTYQGETFYQSGTIPDQMGRSVGTILQVVRNPGWLMPYISCFMVAIGMLIHFGITLVRFIERSKAQ